jgi:hypothetical protein
LSGPNPEGVKDVCHGWVLGITRGCSAKTPHARRGGRRISTQELHTTAKILVGPPYSTLLMQAERPFRPVHPVATIYYPVDVKQTVPGGGLGTVWR